MIKYSKFIINLILLLFFGLLVLIAVKYFASSKHFKYVPINPVVVEYIHIDTVYITKTITRVREAKVDTIKIDSIVASIRDTVIQATNNDDTLTVWIKYYLPPINKFDYEFSWKNKIIEKKIIDSVFVFQNIEVPKCSWKDLGLSAVAGVVIGIVLGVLVH